MAESVWIIKLKAKKSKLKVESSRRKARKSTFKI